MKLFSVGTFILIFNIVFADGFSLSRTGGGTDLCESACDIDLVREQAITKALEDGKNKLQNECEEKRQGVITNFNFPEASEIKCLSYEIEGGEVISCKAQVEANCDIS